MYFTKSPTPTTSKRNQKKARELNPTMDLELWSKNIYQIIEVGKWLNVIKIQKEVLS